MRSTATTVDEYIESVPEERKPAIKKLRGIFKKNLPKGFEERMSYGMIGYVVPHSLYPAGYHCDPKLPLPFINIGSQKNSITIHHLGLYGDEKLMKWFMDEHKKASPKKPDIGKGCIRYKKAEDIPFDLLAALAKKLTPKEFISKMEALTGKR